MLFHHLQIHQKPNIRVLGFQPGRPYTRVTNSDYLENAIKARELNEKQQGSKEKAF